MPTRTPPFLAHLGLDAEADERTVRRAYAQRLKRIDQAADAAGFQALREAYEHALRWVAWRREQALEVAREESRGEAEEAAAADPAAQATVAVERVRSSPVANTDLIDTVPMPLVPELPAHAAPAAPTAPKAPTMPSVAPVAPPAARQPAPEAEPEPAAPPASALDSAETLADAVFTGFVAQRDQVFRSEAEAQAALEHALADDRLINLEARAMFEWRVACLLVEGWRPGHEFLFGPAGDVFHWEQERRALAVFGRVGAALNAAVDERLMFFRLPPHEFEAYRLLIQRLRSDEEPSSAELARSVPVLRQLAQRYPQWLRIITSQARFVRWNEAFNALSPGQQAALRKWSAPKAAARPPQPVEKPFTPPPQRSFPLWGVGIGLFILLRLLMGLGDGGHKVPSSQRWSPPAQTAPSPELFAPATPSTRQGSFDSLYRAPDALPPKPQPRASAPASNASIRAELLGEVAKRQQATERALKNAADELDAAAVKSAAPVRTGSGREEAFGETPSHWLSPTADSPTTAATSDVTLSSPSKALKPKASEGEGGASLSPDTGAAPRLSYELGRPADAASTPSPLIVR